MLTIHFNKTLSEGQLKYSNTAIIKTKRLQFHYLTYINNYHTNTP